MTPIIPFPKSMGVPIIPKTMGVPIIPKTMGVPTIPSASLKGIRSVLKVPTDTHFKHCGEKLCIFTMMGSAVLRIPYPIA